MSKLEVFFWFCKEQKIMDVVFMYYHLDTPRLWKYSSNGESYYSNLSLKDAIDCATYFGFDNLFWKIFPKCYGSKRYSNAVSKWNRFAKNNVKFSDEFVKVGDTIEINDGFTNIVKNGIVTEIPKVFNGSVFMQTLGTNTVITVNLLANCKIKINGEERIPEFYIKRKRKLYGIEKR